MCFNVIWQLWFPQYQPGRDLADFWFAGLSCGNIQCCCGGSWIHVIFYMGKNEEGSVCNSVIPDRSCCLSAEPALTQTQWYFALTGHDDNNWFVVNINITDCWVSTSTCASIPGVPTFCWLVSYYSNDQANVIYHWKH